eukprot:GHVS01064652.1.p1 GENE.GHVS01064652.1~~GHVS01064652.1.p1  ORF type:complete len:345 (-),score=15.59 GHVS01064652.1:53-1087(-)
MCLAKKASSYEVCDRVTKSYRDYYNNLQAFWASRDDFKSIRNAVVIGLQLLDYNRKCCNNMFYGKRCSVARLSNLCRSDATINEDSSLTLHRGHLASIELVMSAELAEVFFKLLSHTSDNGLLFPSNKNSLRPMSPKEWRADLHRAERASGVRKPAKDEEKGDYMQQEKETGANRFRFSPNQVSDAYRTKTEKKNCSLTRFRIKKEELSSSHANCSFQMSRSLPAWMKRWANFIPPWISPISRTTDFSVLSDLCLRNRLLGTIVWRMGYPFFVPARKKKALTRRKQKRRVSRPRSKILARLVAARRPPKRKRPKFNRGPFSFKKKIKFRAYWFAHTTAPIFYYF